MKRIIAAVSFVAIAAPAFAAEVAAPFEQTQFDRAVPSVQKQDAERAASGSTQSGNIWAQDYNFVAPAY